MADRWGNVVTYTFTIEQIAGSAIVVPGYGFLLNNELTDFNFSRRRRARPEPAGRRQAAALEHGADDRAPATAARCWRSARPGGSTIITTVLQILSTSSTSGMSLPDAIAAPRASQRNTPTTQAEPAFLAARRRPR